MAEVRIAAVGDVHVHEGNRQEWHDLVQDMAREADILVLAGDLTNRGRVNEAEVLLEGVLAARLPVVAVLGNHDLESDQRDEITQMLCRAGIHLLDEEPCELLGVGFAGVKGFCGGFDRHALAPFGEQMIKAFVRESLDDALRLEKGLSMLRTEHKVAVLHYAPVRDTVEGEPPEIFPFLGSSRLADPLEHYAVDVAVHGHAHNGSPDGRTARGIPVHNVALPLMRRTRPEQPYLVITFEGT